MYFKHPKVDISENATPPSSRKSPEITLDERFEARVLEREARILEGQYRDRPST
jgi:hypothetical protein